MTKADIAGDVAREADITKTLAAICVDAVIDAIKTNRFKPGKILRGLRSNE